MDSGQNDFSLKNFFTPLTTSKAIHIIVVVGFIVYLNMFFNGFVWDDLSYIIDNPEIHRFDLFKLIGQNTFNSSGYFRPLPAVYFSLMYNLFGSNAFFYHFVQFILHLVCTGLIYLFFTGFFKNWLSLLLSLTFLVHPINVESVSYIGASQSQIYLIFGLLAIKFFSSEKMLHRQVMLTHLFLFLSLFTKEVSVVFFLLIYIYRSLFKLKIPGYSYIYSFLTILIYLLIRLSVLGKFLHHMQMIPISQISLLDRLFHIPLLFFYYLKTFIYPDILVIDQIWVIKTLTLKNFYLPLVFCAVIISFLLFFGFRLYKSKKSYAGLYWFFLIWFFSAMAFLMQVFPLDMTVADRWFYLPMVGLLGLLGIFFNYHFAKIIEKRKTLLLSIFIIILSLFSLRTIVRNFNWKNQLTLYLHDLKYYDNYDLENFLGAELVAVGRIEEALVRFKKSADLNPHDTNLYNVGSVYETLKDYQNAKAYYKKTLAEPGNDPGRSPVRQLAYQGLIKLLLIYDRPEDADQYARNAVKDFPQNGTLLAYLAIIDYKLNRYESALMAAQKAVELLPNSTTQKMYQIMLEKKPLDLRLE